MFPRVIFSLGLFTRWSPLFPGTTKIFSLHHPSTTQSVVTKHIIIMDPVVRTHPCGARRGCGEDTVIWSRGEGEEWRGWWAAGGQCWQWPHYLPPPPAGLQQSQQTRDTINFHPQTFLNKHGLRSDKKILSKRIVFWIGVTVWIWCRFVMIP